ncbi:hypothetical protein [Streptomyces sp. WAC 01420]|uniref:hypothetical protein n=1 Tax=Streptomyces sp. WAC 01420 TaxID=2203203 RepID=UPI000F890EF9|nr:hypothetical protein [Streptomyces sp. WAC 01420]
MAAQQQTIEAQADLVQAVKARAASEQALTNSTQLVSVLLVMIGRLSEQITQLERANKPSDKIRTRLAATRTHLTQAQIEMNRAETERQQALLMVRQTDDRVAELRMVLQKVQLARHAYR